MDKKIGYAKIKASDILKSLQHGPNYALCVVNFPGFVEIHNNLESAEVALKEHSNPHIGLCIREITPD